MLKHKILQRIINRRTTAIAAVLLTSIAICMPAVANSLDNIKDKTLHSYTGRQLELGAGSLPVTSRVLYREALKTLETGEWEKAREKLILSASLSADYPDPMFTLARLELFHAHPDFLFHLLEGIKRLAASYSRQALLAFNMSVLVVTVTALSLLFILTVLLVKYWQLIEHRVCESYSKKYAFPPGRFIMGLIALGLVVMRLGVALYLAILIILLWSFISSREKRAVAAMAIFLAMLSFASPLSSIFTPGIDQESVTSRMALINESGASSQMLDSIKSIDDNRFLAEKEFALGTLKYRLGLYDEAREHLLGSVSMRSDFAPAYLNLGNVYFMQSDFNKALAGYQNVVAIDSTNSLAYFNIGQAYINKMLFAESSSALGKASEHGIEKYRASHPAMLLRKISVYEEGFSPRQLWSIAFQESRGSEALLLDRIVRPWLLFPLHLLGYLIACSLVAAMVIGRRFSGSFNVFKCDNCGTATCSECADDKTGLNLCPGCSSVIAGLSSIKVMEALLRHRRQKISAGQGSKNRWKILLLPGSIYIWSGKTLQGIMATTVNFTALLILVWNGLYLKAPRELTIGTSLWMVTVPLFVLAAGYIWSLRIKPPQLQRNFRVLPADFSIDVDEVRQEKRQVRQVRPEPETNDERFETFLNSL